MSALGMTRRVRLGPGLPDDQCAQAYRAQADEDVHGHLCSRDGKVPLPALCSSGSLFGSAKGPVVVSVDLTLAPAGSSDIGWVLLCQRGPAKGHECSNKQSNQEHSQAFHRLPLARGPAPGPRHSLKLPGTPRECTTFIDSWEGILSAPDERFSNIGAAGARRYRNLARFSMNGADQACAIW